MQRIKKKVVAIKPLLHLPSQQNQGKQFNIIHCNMIHKSMDVQQRPQKIKEVTLTCQNNSMGGKSDFS